ncbi:MAG: NAD(P)-dependent oxidoreductase [Actinomycetota bacterium]
MATISVLGLGAMGSRMAVNWAAAGHDVIVWNRTRSTALALVEQHVVTIADTPSDAAARADVVVSMVADDDAARAVWLGDDGALAAMRNDAVAIESSTLTPATVRMLGAAASDRGVAFVEAPVVGSRPQAEVGALLYLVGGTAEAIDAIRPIIDVNAGNVRHVGALGDAATMKLAINGLFATQVAAYAETVAMLERSGFDRANVTDTLGELPITSPGLQRILGLIAEQTYEPNFPVRLVAKDLGYLVQVADLAGAPVPVSSATGAVFASAVDEGLGESDIAGVAGRYGL